MGIALIMQMHCNDTKLKNYQNWTEMLNLIRNCHFEFMELELEKEQEKEKKIHENAPVQDILSQDKDILSQDKATNSKNDSNDSDDKH